MSSEMLSKYLQVYVPSGKLMEFYALLFAWLGAIVFGFAALLQVSKIWTSGAGLTYSDTEGKANKQFATFASLSGFCLILVQFLTLRVTLACDSCTFSPLSTRS
jgi:hypothetical protein